MVEKDTVTWKSKHQVQNFFLKNVGIRPALGTWCCRRPLANLPTPVLAELQRSCCPSSPALFFLRVVVCIGVLVYLRGGKIQKNLSFFLWFYGFKYQWFLQIILILWSTRGIQCFKYRWVYLYKKKL